MSTKGRKRYIMNQKSSNKVDIDLLAQAFAEVLTRRTGIKHVCRIRNEGEISNNKLKVSTKKAN
ncbi:TPA: hypothetical protein IUX93_001817 [Enterococcus faecalis]|nr:hypothetical protein [Enterococcus faecalis]HAP4914532.1 hypothetical protein [Enterococcus faecalis]HAP4920499.1 hypothetical protein [Enterococcus faecalis]